MGKICFDDRKLFSKYHPYLSPADSLLLEVLSGLRDGFCFSIATNIGMRYDAGGHTCQFLKSMPLDHHHGLPDASQHGGDLSVAHVVLVSAAHLMRW